MIIDASVAFKWLADEPDSDLARQWIGRADLIAPTLLFAEVGNAIWKQVRRKEFLSDAPLQEQLADLAQIVTTVDESSVAPRALEMAIALDHAIYDCVYLALAEDMNDRVLTADRKFIRTVGATPLSQFLQPLA